jgi:hypothetical protein
LKCTFLLSFSKNIREKTRGTQPMTEDQAEILLDILTDILSELRGLGRGEAAQSGCLSGAPEKET